MVQENFEELGETQQPQSEAEKQAGESVQAAPAPMPDEEMIRRIQEQEAAKQTLAQPAVDLDTVNAALAAIAQKHPDAVSELRQVLQVARMQREVAEAERMRAIIRANKETGAPIDYLEKHSDTPQELEAAVKAWKQQQASQQPAPSSQPAAQPSKPIPPSRQVAPVVGKTSHRSWGDISPSDMESLIARAKRGKLSAGDLP